VYAFLQPDVASQGLAAGAGSPTGCLLDGALELGGLDGMMLMQLLEEDEV
jgi:hypothetical protein